MDLQRLVEKFFELSNIVSGLVARWEIGIADQETTKLKAENNANRITALETRFNSFENNVRLKEEAESRNEQTDALTRPQHRQSAIAVWALVVSIAVGIITAATTVYVTIYVATHPLLQSVPHH